MISRSHDDAIPTQEATPSSIANKQVATPLDKRSQPTGALPQRWMSVWRSILVVLLPLVAGSMISWPWGVGDLFDAAWVFWTVTVATCLLTFVGAALLRSPWALLIVPVAWIGGEFLGAIVPPLLEGGWSTLQAAPHFWDVQGTIIPLGLLPVLLCALVGTPLGMLLKERQQRR